jgi:hypothetical protein
VSVVALDDVKRHLNLTVTTHDGEIQAFIDSAEAAIGERVGPLASTTQTVRVRGCSRSLVLPLAPAVSLTSVTPADSSTALTLSDLYLDAEAGIVRYESGGTFGARHYDVVYEAGRATCPADLKLAVKELVRHLWTTQRGATARPGSRESEAASNTLPGAAYVFPFRVEQLLAPHEQPGFA